MKVQQNMFGVQTEGQKVSRQSVQESDPTVLTLRLDQLSMNESGMIVAS